MNKVNILKLIDVISNEDNFFSMVSFFIEPPELEYPVQFKNRYNAEPPDCGTPACIGGWVTHLAKGNIDTPDEKLGAWLGLDADETNKLFYPRHKLYKEISRQEAIDVLENIIITNEVNWTYQEGAYNYE